MKDLIQGLNNTECFIDGATSAINGVQEVLEGVERGEITEVHELYSILQTQINEVCEAMTGVAEAIDVDYEEEEDFDLCDGCGDCVEGFEDVVEHDPIRTVLGGPEPIEMSLKEFFEFLGGAR